MGCRNSFFNILEHHKVVLTRERPCGRRRPAWACRGCPSRADSKGVKVIYKTYTYYSLIPPVNLTHYADMAGPCPPFPDADSESK
ncbi:hypothetical protein J6590_033482 [Homalodisca vitripennis]|nr:hypothetical protein J6590_033482 [Homalodisca vitripennis]